MKNIKKIGLLLLISGLVTGFAQAADQSGGIFATSAADGGRLVISRSPVLGYKARIDLAIDGRPVGLLTRGRPFDRYVTLGRHILTAAPSRGAASRTVLDVRAGETYSYTASYNVSRLVLARTTGSR